MLLEPDMEAAQSDVADGKHLHAHYKKIALNISEAVTELTSHCQRNSKGAHSESPHLIHTRLLL